MTGKPRRPTLRRTTVALLAAIWLVGLTAGSSTSAAGADTDPSLPTSSMPVVSPHIIPRPNSGAPAESATDRGGWAQYAVLGGIVLALGLIVVLVRRESLRKRAAGERLGGGASDGADRPQDAATSTRREPQDPSSSNLPDSSART